MLPDLEEKNNNTNSCFYKTPLRTKAIHHIQNNEASMIDLFSLSIKYVGFLRESVDDDSFVKYIMKMKENIC